MNKLEKKINILISIFFIIIGFSSVSLSLENNLIVTFILGFLILILFILLKNNYFSFENKFSKIYIITLFLVFLISLINSPYNFDYMWIRYLGIILSIIFGVFGYFISKNKNFNLNLICQVMTIIGLIHCLVLIFLWFSLENPQSYNWVLDIPFFSNIRHLADYLSICFLASLFIVIKEKSKFKFFNYVCSLMILSVIIWTGSRAAYLGLSITLILLCCFKIQAIKKLILLLITAMIFQPFFITNSSSLGLFRSADRLGQSLDAYSSGRIGLYHEVLLKVMESPIWGLGPEAVRNSGISNGITVFAQAHNLILQILIEFGIVGLLVISLILFKSLLKIKNIKNSFTAVYLSLFCLNITVAALFNGGFYYIITLHLFCFFYGALLANLDSKSTIRIS